jgi:TolB-like protein
VAAIGALLAAGGVGIGLYLRMPRAGGQIDSIAVLPLEIRSNDPDAEYMSDGITESVNNSLARLPNLKVFPRSIANHPQREGENRRDAGGPGRPYRTDHTAR